MGDENHDTEEKTYTDKDRSSLFKTMKKAIGLDLTSVAVPVVFNEPISFLQRMYEFVQFWDLLEKADNCPDPDLRLAYVTAFAISNYASTTRSTKPFNPMLGETFELSARNYRFVSEQVCHHPPIGATHLETNSFVLEQTMVVKSKFKGNSLDIAPETVSVINFKSHEDKYYFQGIKTKIHNVIVGRMWIDHMGELVVQSATDENRKAVITFKECGWFSKNFRVVDAVVYNSDGNAVFELSGKWNDTINAKRLIDSKVDLEEEFNFRLDEDQVIWENTIKTVSNKYKKMEIFKSNCKNS